MEQAIQDLVKTVSIPGVVALGILIILKPLMPVFIEYLKAKMSGRIITDTHKQAIETVGQEVQTIGSNHLHEVKDILQEIRDGQKTHQALLQNIDQRITSTNESLAFLRGRLNGKNH